MAGEQDRGRLLMVSESPTFISRTTDTKVYLTSCTFDIANRLFITCIPVLELDSSASSQTITSIVTANLFCDDAEKPPN